ncbi:hypothetical protein MMC12_000656 [Toensbergia leucococca]|nr:hypothetical protein [Toensbergia leucococca]
MDPPPSSQPLDLESGPPPIPPELPWNSSHPCFPHPNPHVPLSSPLYAQTRIIRIPRSWLPCGDLAPTFSNTYPEILSPWIPEADFRLLIRHVNAELMRVFGPWGWRNWADACMGVATGWVWEDVGAAKVKRGIRGVETWLEEWGARWGEGVAVVPLRRTGYLSLDIQIPDPQVGFVESDSAASRPPTTTTETKPETLRTRPSTVENERPVSREQQG